MQCQNVMLLVQCTFQFAVENYNRKYSLNQLHLHLFKVINLPKPDLINL